MPLFGQDSIELAGNRGVGSGKDYEMGFELEFAVSAVALYVGPLTTIGAKVF